jgi:GNAT superfamily N-acetyltransferase
MTEDSPGRVTRYLATFSASIAQLPGASEVHHPNFSGVFTHRAMFNRFYDREWPSRLMPGDVLAGAALARGRNVRPVWIVDHSARSPRLLEAFREEGFTTSSEWIGMEHDLEQIVIPSTPSDVTVAVVDSPAMLALWATIASEADGYTPAQNAVFLDLFSRLGWTSSGWKHLLAAVGPRAVATASLLRIGELAAIDWVHTIPEARGKGIASYLVALLLHDAAASRCSHAVLTSTEMGEGVYRRAGFRQCSRVSAFRLPSPQSAVSS